MHLPLATLTRWARPTRIAHAHCDIPCGIYDPHQAELAAETVEKMVTLLQGLGPDDGSLAWRNSASRYITVKEQHGELLKHEVLIIWGDYFKPQHLDAAPTLHDTVWNLIKLAGYNKQNVDLAKAGELRAKTKEFADIFWASKQ